MSDLKGIMAFFGVWFCGCAIADYVIVTADNPWMMAWGFFAGSLAIHVGEWIRDSKPTTESE